MNEIPEASRPGAPCRRIAVMCPDAGIDASYFAAALAAYLAKVGAGEQRQVVLVDGQHGIGGIDVLCDLDAAPGARWPALRGAGADIDAHKLLAALPHREGVAVLSHSRSGPDVDESVHIAVVGALTALGASLVVTAAPHTPPTSSTADCVIVLVRGTVAAMAAAEQVMHSLDELPVAVVMLQAPRPTQIAVSEALGVPVVSAAPVRWRLGDSVAEDVLAGRWPGRSDRTMQRIVTDVSVFAATAGRSLAWA